MYGNIKKIYKKMDVNMYPF